MQLTGCRSSPASEVPRGAGLVVIDGLPQAALLESGKPLGFLVQRPLNDIHRSPRLGDRATLVGLTSPEGSWSLDDRNRCTIDPLRSPLSNVWYMLIAVIAPAGTHRRFTTLCRHRDVLGIWSAGCAYRSFISLTRTPGFGQIGSLFLNADHLEDGDRFGKPLE